MRLFHELGSLRRLLALPSACKRIVFYAETANDHAYLEGYLGEIAERAPDTAVYLTSDPQDPLLLAPPAGVRVYLLRRWLSLYMAFCSPRVFVMTLTDLKEYHLRRSMHAVHYVYAFHAMISTHMVTLETSLDHYDSLLCVGPHQVKELRAREEQAQLSPRELVEVGYPRFERIRSAWLAKSAAPETGSDAEVLIAASWHRGNLLEACGAELIEALLRLKFRVRLRLHPEMQKRDPGLIAALGTKFDSRMGFQIDTSVRGDEALLDADLLITDWSAVAFEYALGTERPVLFIDVPPKVRNPNYQSLGLEPVEISQRKTLGLCLDPTDLGELESCVQQLLGDRERWRDCIRAAGEQLTFSMQGAAKRGADHILNLAQLEESS